MCKPWKDERGGRSYSDPRTWQERRADVGEREQRDTARHPE